MVLADRIKSFFGIEKKELIAELPTQQQRFFVRYAPLQGTFNNIIRHGYKGNSAVFACMSELAKTFPEPELWEWELNSEGKYEKVENSRFRDLITAPNADMGEAEFFEFCITYAAMGGNTYIWKEPNLANGGTIGLYPFSDKDIVPIPAQNTGDGLVAYFVLLTEGSQASLLDFPRWDGLSGVAIPKEQIIHWKWKIDPEYPWLGIGAITAAMRDISTNNEIMDYQYSLFKNDATPPLVVTLPPETAADDALIARVRSKWMAKYGRSNRGTPAVVPHGTNVDKLGFDFRELQIDKMQDLPESRIAAGFGISPMVVGLLVGLQNSTYSNYKEAREALTIQTLVPLWRNFASEFSRALRDEFGRIAFDLGQVRALEKNASELWERLGNALAKGGITRAEYRSMVGLETSDLDNVYYIPNNLRVVAVNEDESSPTYDKEIVLNQQRQVTTSTRVLGELAAGKLTPEAAVTMLTSVAGMNEELARNLVGGVNVSQPKQDEATHYLKADFDYSNSAMIALYPDEATAYYIHGKLTEAFLNLDIMPASELHVTMIYLGDIGNVSKENVVDGLLYFTQEKWDCDSKPNGFGFFNAEDRPLYINIDGKHLSHVRNELVKELEYYWDVYSDSEHGFTPHMTAAYLGENPIPTEYPELNTELKFRALTLKWGNERIDFPFGGDYKAVPSQVRPLGINRHEKPHHLQGMKFPNGLGTADPDNKATEEELAQAAVVVAGLRQVKNNLLTSFTEEVDAYFDMLADVADEALLAAVTVNELGLANIVMSEANQKELVDIFDFYLRGVISGTWEYVNEQTENFIPLNFSDPNIDQILIEAGKRVVGISEETRLELVKILQYGNQNGWSVDDLRLGRDGEKGIIDIIKETYKNRGRAIARTELGTAQNLASTKRYRAGRIKEVVVMDNGLKNSDPFCTAIDGSKQSLDWAESNPLQHPNCVRAFAPLFRD